MNLPIVSVVMSVFNGEKYLAEAIDSILAQTFADFEFIIINDASTDDSLKIINSYNDVRIKLIENKSNIGLTKSLNKGIKIAKGKYIARMDADDISLPERFERQYSFMEKNSLIGVCGTWYKMFGDEEAVIETLKDNEEIKILMLVDPALGHPTVFIKRKLIIEHNIFYNETIKYAQDYEFWINLIPYSIFANISTVLLHYRVHNEQVSINKREEQRKYADIARLKILQYLNLQLSNEFDRNI